MKKILPVGLALVAGIIILFVTTQFLSNNGKNTDKINKEIASTKTDLNIVGRDETGQFTFYNSEKESINSKGSGTVTVDHGIDWYAEIDKDINKNLAEGNGLKTTDKPVDSRNAQPINPDVLTFLDDLNKLNGYIFQNPNLPEKEITIMYQNLWGGAFAKKIGLQAQETENKKIKTTDPQMTKVLTIEDTVNNLEYCALDTRYLGAKINNPGIFDMALISGSCQSFFAKLKTK